MSDNKVEQSDPHADPECPSAPETSQPGPLAKSPGGETSIGSVPDTAVGVRGDGRGEELLESIQSLKTATSKLRKLVDQIKQFATKSGATVEDNSRNQIDSLGFAISQLERSVSGIVESINGIKGPSNTFLQISGYSAIATPIVLGLIFLIFAIHRSSDKIESESAYEKIDIISDKIAATPATPIVAPTTDPSLSGRLDAVQRDLKKVVADGQDLKSRLTQQPPRVDVRLDEADLKRISDEIGSAKVPPDLADTVAKNVQSRLDAKFEEMKKAGGKPGSVSAFDSKMITDAVRQELGSKDFQNAIADQMIKRWKDAQPKESPTPLTGADLDKALKDNAKSVKDDIIETVKRESALLTDKVDKATRLPAPAEPLDVIVVAAHSRRLPVNDWMEPYKRLVASLPRDAGNRYRLGFYLAVTDKLRPKVDLKDGKIGEGSFYTAAPDGSESERPDLFGSDLLDRFDANRPNQRCILVASTRCEAPKPEAEGWKSIPVVDVILIRTEGKGGNTVAMSGWLDFCSAKNGNLILLAAGESKGAKSPGEQLYEHLYRLANPQGRK